MKLDKILIVDGSYMLHRGLKQENIFNLRNSYGMRTGGVYAFLQMLQKELNRNITNYFPIVCWDDGLSSRRLAVYDNYKKHRDHLEDPSRKLPSQMTDEELDEDYVYNYHQQRSLIIETLNNIGIPSLLFRHTEGDDLMKWLVEHSEKSIIISDDKDMVQLLSPTCKIRQPMKDRVLVYDTFMSENEFTDIQEFINEKCVLGDSSDNIPSSCKGVGEKSVKDLLKFVNLVEGFTPNDDDDKIKEYKTLAESHGFKFKKAFLNFNNTQFLKNIELIDLKKVKDSEYKHEAIYERISTIYKNENLKGLFSKLHELEIRNIDITGLCESVAMSKVNVKE